MIGLRTLADGDASLPLLVVGPSLGTTVETLWTPVADRLAGRFRIVGWDLPGHGGVPSVDRVAVAELADAVADAVPEDVFVYAGDSVGGAVGLQLLLEHADRVSAAALCCTAARIGTPESWSERADTVRREGIAAMVEPSAARWFAPDFADRDPATARALLDALAAGDAEGYVAVCGALGSFDVRGRLPEIDTPTVAIAGRDDVAVPVDTMRATAQGIARSRFVALDDTGHQAPAEQPDTVAALIASLAPPVDPLPAAGRAMRSQVAGAAHVERAESSTTPFTADFQDFITRYAWGEVWTRPGLDRRSRSLITLTALVAGGHYEELGMHVRGALRNGLSADEIRETLLHTAIYCGVPAANAAFRVAAEVIAEHTSAGEA